MSFWHGVFISADRIYLKVNLEVNSLSKAIIAKKRYKGQGRYINEILGDIIIDENYKQKMSKNTSIL